MKKQRLKLGDLQVETFTTSGERPGGRGTVFGRVEDTDSCFDDTCQCQTVVCNTWDEAYQSECCGTVTMDLEAC